MNTGRIEEDFLSLAKTADSFTEALIGSVELAVANGLKVEQENKEAREQARAQRVLEIQQSVHEKVYAEMGVDLLTALRCSVKTTERGGGTYDMCFTLRYKDAAFGLVVCVSVNTAGNVYEHRYFVNGINLDNLQECKGAVYEVIYGVEYAMRVKK